MNEFGKKPRIPTGSRRKIKYSNMRRLPAMLKYQKETGTTLSFFLSEASH
jgi:hypothetical protein